MCLVELKYIIYMTNYILPVISSSESTENAQECALMAFNGGHQSFFYHQQNHQCVLQSEKIHLISELSQGTGYKYWVQDGPTCGPPPTVVNGNLVSVGEVNEKFTAEYSCPTGYYFPGPKTSTCSDSIWSTGMQCNTLTTCNDVKLCNPSYQDGEYWIYHNVLSLQKIRLYCYGMTTQSPKEYLTLHGYNDVEFPLGVFEGHGLCSEIIDEPSFGSGDTVYKKIRINPQSLTVIKDDYQFTNQIYGTPRPYGEPFACSKDYSMTCRKRGLAIINIADTGFKLSSDNTWVPVGPNGRFDITLQTPYIMNLYGDGSCGGGALVNPLKLEIDASTMISSSESTENAQECALMAFNGGHQSFFYHQQNHQCVLQSEKIHLISELSQGTGYKYWVQDGPTCGPPPTVVNGNLVSVGEVNEKFTAEYSCPTGYYFPGPKTSTCSDSTWSTGMQCNTLTTCNDVKLCNPSYQDGEYWIYHNVLSLQKVRLYCYGMTTQSPKEYLTLPEYNNINFPPGVYKGTGICSKIIDEPSFGSGDTVFNKIRINPQSLTVIKDDYQFIYQIKGEPRPYGEPFACSKDYSMNCPKRGVVILDISKTGFKLSSDNAWVPVGPNGRFAITFQSPYMMNLKGDGSCGGGVLVNPLKLEIDASTTPPTDSAIVPNCS